MTFVNNAYIMPPHSRLAIWLMQVLISVEISIESPPVIDLEDILRFLVSRLARSVKLGGWPKTEVLIIPKY